MIKKYSTIFEQYVEPGSIQTIQFGSGAGNHRGLSKNYNQLTDPVRPIPEYSSNKDMKKAMNQISKFKLAKRDWLNLYIKECINALKIKKNKPKHVEYTNDH